MSANGGTTALATKPIETALATPHGISLSGEQVELLKRTVCKGATNDELGLFLNTAQRLGLDPFSKQIHAVKRYDSKERREVMAIQVGIDGFRLTAQRSGEYEGQVGPQWCGKDGAWRDVWLEETPPAVARVGVLRRGFREPLWRSARWASYAQTYMRDGKQNLSPMWSKMPDLMLAKCAEALALRAAFPAELSGVYEPSEMTQAETYTPPAAAAAPPPDGLVNGPHDRAVRGEPPHDATTGEVRDVPADEPKANPQQVKAFFASARKVFGNDAAVKAYLTEKTGKTSTKEVGRDAMSALLTDLKAKESEMQAASDAAAAHAAAEDRQPGSDDE